MDVIGTYMKKDVLSFVIQSGMIRTCSYKRGAKENSLLILKFEINYSHLFRFI